MKSTNKTKITLGIIIDTDLKIPPATGVTYRLYYLSKSLSKQKINIKLFICNRSIKNKQDEQLLYEKSQLEYHIIPEAIFYNPSKLLNIIKDQKIDILQFEDAFSTLKYKNISTSLKIPVCLEMHDVEASLKEMLNYHSQQIEESKKTSQEACDLATATVCMTPLDYFELTNKIGVEKKKLSIVPNPIDLHKFKFFGPNIKSDNIIFVGNMFYWPNQNATLNIIDKIVPKILSTNKGAKFYFIGMVPKEIKKRGNKNIIFTGIVNNLNNYLKNASIALCPVYEGSGMKVKILNYCAAGIPIITTSIGSSGYEKIDSLIIENNIEKYAEIISNVLKNKKTIIEIGAKNRLNVEKYFDINKISKKMIKLYKNILRSKNNTINTSQTPRKTSSLLWLSEKRIEENNNNNYYIIKNGKTILKKKII